MSDAPSNLKSGDKSISASDALQGAMTKNIKPFRVALLREAGDFPGLSDMFPAAAAFAFDEAYARHIIDRPVELIEREFEGQPANDAFPVCKAFRELAEEQGVIACIGPLTSDNALSVMPEIERIGLPTFSICGSEEFAGPYSFNLSNGSLCDEPSIMSAWIAQQGFKRAAVVRDYPSVIGLEYSRYFRYACELKEVSIVLEGNVSPTVDSRALDQALELAHSANADVLVHLGVGTTAPHINKALEELAWNPPKIMNSCFMGSSYNNQYAQAIEGWVGIDQYDERNSIMTGLRKRYKQTHIGKELLPNSAVTAGYDCAQALAIGLGRMKISTRKALRDALETVRRLPAACGAPGTVIAFGPYDHRGYKGADYLVLRRVHNGKLEPVGTAPVE